MALIGLNLNRINPLYSSDDFAFWAPQYANFLKTLDGNKYFNKIYKLANNKVFKSIFGTDWTLAMSYVISHYLTLISNQLKTPAGDELAGIYGNVSPGVLASAGVGEFNKTYDLNRTLIDSDEAKFWNQTAAGQSFMSLVKTKALPSIFVITSNPEPYSSSIYPLHLYKDLLDDEYIYKWEYDQSIINVNFSSSTAEIIFNNESIESATLSLNINLPENTVIQFYLNGVFEISYGSIIIPKKQYNQNFNLFIKNSTDNNTLTITMNNAKNTFIGRMLVRTNIKTI